MDNAQIFVTANQGSKGIRQYFINWSTSPVMIHKITPFITLHLVVGHLIY